MAGRKSYDSVDDLERLVTEEHTKSVPSGNALYTRAQRPGRLWSILGYTAAISLVFSVGYLGGIYSHNSEGSPWVIGPLGAPYANSPVYEDLGASRPVIVKATHIGEHNPFTGTPSGRTSLAWKALMSGYNVRVPRRLLQPGQDSIPLSDGSDDVVGSLGVFHYLHCLDSIRHQIAGMGCHDTDWGADGVLPAHFDHCIESLRQWLICQPDLTLRTTYWTQGPDGETFAQANNTVEHTCVDWSRVAEWTQERQMRADDGLVRTPSGEVWPWMITAPPICSSHDV
jgi:hypothetical protein